MSKSKSSFRSSKSRRKQAEKELNTLLAVIPNVPLDDVPDGPDEHANVEHHRCGREGRVRVQAKQHFELGEALGLMDFETAAKLSGARFVVLKGGLARMERALGQFMLDLHTAEHGYTEVNPPLMVRDDVMFGTGQLPKFEDDQFLALNKSRIRSRRQLARRFLRGRRICRIAWTTKKIVKSSMPCRRRVSKQLDYAASLAHPHRRSPAHQSRPRVDRRRGRSCRSASRRCTPCFRAEAGAAGKDTRGMLRQHQFNKVELVSITTPEQAVDEHERMLTCAEEVLRRLDLHYRVVTLCDRRHGFCRRRRPTTSRSGCRARGPYREISSCSVCGDFQARRMKARYRAQGREASPRFVHTLNGSGVAVGRALIAVMENYQNADGSITVPDALAPYMGGMEKIERAKMELPLCKPSCPGSGPQRRSDAVADPGPSFLRKPSRAPASAHPHRLAESESRACASSSPTTTASTRRGSTSASGSRGRCPTTSGWSRRRYDQSGVVAFAVAQRSAPPARGQRAALRGAAARRPIASSWRARHARPSARPRALRRQPRPERRRRRDLFRHRRRRHGGPLLGIPSIALSQALSAANKQRRTGRRRASMRPIISTACSRPASRATCWSTSIFRIARPSAVKGVAVSTAGQARPAVAAHRRAPRRPRQPVLLDRLCARRQTDGKRTAPISPLSPTTASR